MSENFDKVLELLNTRNIISTDTGEMEATTYIMQAAFEIKAYCNIPEKAPMPVGLLYTWADVAAELYTAATRASNGVISAIKEGDTTIEYQSVSDQGASSALNAHRSTLNRYRRLA